MEGKGGMGKNRELKIMEMGRKGRGAKEGQEKGRRRRQEDGKGKGKWRDGKVRREGKGEVNRRDVLENRDFYQTFQLWGLLYPPHPKSGPKLACNCGPMV